MGVDIVGDKLLELNVFTPGGIHSIQELYGLDVADIVTLVDRPASIPGAWDKAAAAAACGAWTARPAGPAAAAARAPACG